MIGLVLKPGFSPVGEGMHYHRKYAETSHAFALHYTKQTILPEDQVCESRFYI